MEEKNLPIILTQHTDLNGCCLYCSKKSVEKVKALAIEHIESKISLRIVTVSLGVASTIPQSSEEPTLLVSEADLALYKSKEKGRDQVTLSPILNYRFSYSDKRSQFRRRNLEQ